MTMKHVLVLGGAGDMATVAVRGLLALRDDVQITLADRDQEKAARRAKGMGPDRVDTIAVDVFDAARLSRIMEVPEVSP